MKKEVSSNKISALANDVGEKAMEQSMSKTTCKSITSVTKRIWSWMEAKVNAHFDRLVELRVYDQRRF